MGDSTTHNATPSIVGLGEALFDCFADRADLGGAPINLIVHANALLPGAAAPATAVGHDKLGERFLAELNQRGVSTAFVQQPAGRDTGTVQVSIADDGHANYTFVPDVAWDALDWTPEWAHLASNCRAVAFGTLAQRSETSRATIQAFLREANSALRFFDVNLRGDFYSAAVLADSLSLATAVKLNEEELDVVFDLLDIGPAAGLDARALALASRYELDWLVVTRGSEGTLLFRVDQRFEAPASATIDPATASPHADSVGAGDACSAALVVGALRGWPPERVLDLANRVGAYVASQPGATPRLPDSLLALAR